jgi:hypothetical protein
MAPEIQGNANISPMIQTTEYQLIQNPALGAVCLWLFARRFWLAKDKVEGPSLILGTVVLPVVFHQETVRLLCRRHYDGGLLSARTDDRTLGTGLQQRISDMLPQTFSSLNFAFASELLGYSPTTGTITLLRETKLHKAIPVDQAEMFWTAERLGFWFATLPVEQVCSHLRISF